MVRVVAIAHACRALAFGLRGFESLTMHQGDVADAAYVAVCKTAEVGSIPTVAFKGAEAHVVESLHLINGRVRFNS